MESSASQSGHVSQAPSVSSCSMGSHQSDTTANYALPSPYKSQAAVQQQHNHHAQHQHQLESQQEQHQSESQQEQANAEVTRSKSGEQQPSRRRPSVRGQTCLDDPNTPPAHGRYYKLRDLNKCVLSLLHPNTQPFRSATICEARMFHSLSGDTHNIPYSKISCAPNVVVTITRSIQLPPVNIYMS